MRLTDFLADILRRVAEVERRLDGTIKQGRVVEVDAAAGTVRLRLNEESADEAFLSPPIPYAQFAGALKVHTPPSVGQQMTIVSGAGDFRQGLAVPMTWSEQNEAPSAKGDENVVTYGGWRLTLDGEKLEATKDDTVLRLTGGDAYVKSPKVVVDSPDVNLGGEGGARVARIGDRVSVSAGSSAGLWPIVEGSSAVKAVD